MLHHISGKRTVGLLISTFVVMFGATSATASAAQTLCIDGPGANVTVATADGTCKAKATAKTLVEQSELDAAQAIIEALETKVAALETKLSKVGYDENGLNGKPTLQINGANLQILNGDGRTETTNGVGNLFIGYNEFPGTQTGSHNLILGPRHSFTRFGGLLAGAANTLTGIYASITGGAANTASGNFSSVSGGSFNTASGHFSSIRGGHENRASGDWSSLLGGRDVTLATMYGTSPSP